MVCDEDGIDYWVDFYSKSKRLSISIFTVIVIDIVTDPYTRFMPMVGTGLTSQKESFSCSDRCGETLGGRRNELLCEKHPI